MKKVGICAFIGIIFLSGFIILIASHAFSGELACLDLGACCGAGSCYALEWWSAPECKIICLSGSVRCYREGPAN
jgi:hypothetical protein